MSVPLSCYILTFNSAARLGQVLSSLRGIVDDLVLVDSGSTDRTAEIASRFGARFVSRKFDDFTTQRKFATSNCVNEWVLAIDSDEVLSPPLGTKLKALKQSGFSVGRQMPDAFAIRREWYVMNRRVHCFYPSRCPDFPVRLFQKHRARYIEGRSVHESMTGFRRVVRIDEPLLHYTCDSVDQMYAKVNVYTTLAARDLRAKGRPTLVSMLLMPKLVMLKWYLLEGAWRDGFLGLMHARYVNDTVYLKYMKARYDLGDAPKLEKLQGEDR